MEAVVSQQCTVQTSQELRQQLCNHLESNVDHYCAYLFDNDQPSDVLPARFTAEIQDLRINGHWSMTVGDIMPLAVANMLNASITIYTSKPTHPVIQFEPSLVEPPTTSSLVLAYCAVPGLEHYDICVPISANKQPTKRSAVSRETDGNKQRPEQPAVSSETDGNKQRPEQPAVSSETDTDHESHVNQTPKKRSADSLRLTQITPRKQAKFSTPPKKNLTRKRQRNEHAWKKKIRTRRRQSGEEYIAASGQSKSKRQVRPKDCTKCRYKCSEKIDENTRKAIFDSYWGTQSYERHRDFLAAYVMEKETAGRGGSENKRKQVAREFMLPASGTSVRVCKAFFLATLDIGQKTVDWALQKKRDANLTMPDQRGRHDPHNKTTDETTQEIMRHIGSFPTIESHYTRKHSKRQYLSSDLTIRRMYSLYREECQQKGRRAASAGIYRKVFCDKFNYNSFHVPKKDQCQLCNDYNQKRDVGSLDADTEAQYTLHQQRKTKSREEKEKDKKLAKEDKSHFTATFDLEAVLSTPCSLVSQVFYKRKLSCYNLSVYSLGNGDGTCYMWNETEGQRGSCEIGTCLLLHLNSLPATVQTVSLYSDTCTGQNRNQFVATALMHAVTTIPNLHIINQKFLEPGHTQMECDSMHSAIEFAKKKTSIYVPSQWDTVVRMARRKKPYHVVPLKHWDIWDFKEVAKQTVKNVQVAASGARVRWREIRHMQFRKDQPGCLLYKLNYDDADFEIVKCRPSRGRKTDSLPRKYSERLPISDAKRADLLSLCSSGIIPEEFQAYYKGIPASKKVVDKLPETDVNDSSDESDDN